MHGNRGHIRLTPLVPLASKSRIWPAKWPPSAALFCELPIKSEGEMDVSNLEYRNSSEILPIIRIEDQCFISYTSRAHIIPHFIQIKVWIYLKVYIIPHFIQIKVWIYLKVYIIPRFIAFKLKFESTWKSICTCINEHSLTTWQLTIYIVLSS